MVLWHINHCRLFNTKPFLYIHIKYIWFNLVGIFGISTIVGFIRLTLFYTYISDMMSKHILLMAFLKEPKIILLYTIKFFLLFQSNTNNSIYYKSFICTQFYFFQAFLCIINNSIKHQSLVYTLAIIKRVTSPL